MLCRADDNVPSTGFLGEGRALDRKPEVNRISSGEPALMSEATCSRAVAMASRAASPIPCGDAGLPNCSVKKGRIASATSGASGVPA
jgi:hypothetical protein